MSENKACLNEVIDMCGDVKGTLRANWCIVRKSDKELCFENIASEMEAKQIVDSLGDEYDYVVDELPEPMEYEEGERFFEVTNAWGHTLYRGQGSYERAKEMLYIISEHPLMQEEEFLIRGEFEGSSY